MLPKFPGWKPNYLQGTLVSSCWLAPARLQPVKRLLVLSPPGRFQSRKNRRRRCLLRPGRQTSSDFLKRIQKKKRKEEKKESLQRWWHCILPFEGLQVCSGLVHRLPTRQVFKTMLLCSLSTLKQVPNKPQKADTIWQIFCFIKEKEVDALEEDWRDAGWIFHPSHSLCKWTVRASKGKIKVTAHFSIIKPLVSAASLHSNDSD